MASSDGPRCLPEVGQTTGSGLHDSPLEAIAAAGSYPSTPLAGTPPPSCPRWRIRDCSGPHASRRVGDVSPILPGRFRHVLCSALLPEPDRAALSTRSDGVSDP